jgi:hypothetical protein
MPADRLSALREQYGAPLPQGLRSLSDAELADLAAALAEAAERQSVALDAAIGHTLRFLPWPLSGIVRKILIG